MVHGGAGRDGLRWVGELGGIGRGGARRVSGVWRSGVGWALDNNPSHTTPSRPTTPHLKPTQLGQAWPNHPIQLNLIPPHLILS